MVVPNDVVVGVNGVVVKVPPVGTVYHLNVLLPLAVATREVAV
jgi:hypothetical protein